MARLRSSSKELFYLRCVMRAQRVRRIIIIGLICLILLMKRRRLRLRMYKEPCRHNPILRIAHLNNMIVESDVTCIEQLRMDRRTFNILCSLVRDIGGLRDTKNMAVEEFCEGSAADGRILRDALERNNGLRVPRGCYYLVDAGYKNAEGFLAPFRGHRYHEWRSGHEQPTCREELFNLRHASARNVIERAFGLLKVRWASLSKGTHYPIDTQTDIMLACFYLHNLIRQQMKDDPFEAQLSQVLDHDVQSNSEDYVLTCETSNQWSEFRNNIAQEMYDAWIARRQV